MRPTLLVAEPEPVGALSARKLVLETGKFNVLTAHSTQEALELIRLHPVPAAILVNQDYIDCDQITDAVKDRPQDVPVIALFRTPNWGRCSRADHRVPSHNPEELLQLLRSLLGDPRTVDTPSSE